MKQKSNRLQRSQVVQNSMYNQGVCTWSGSLPQKVDFDFGPKPRLQELLTSCPWPTELKTLFIYPYIMCRLQRILPPKMPFFVSQIMQISSKILYFANFLPLEYDYKRTFIATFHRISTLFSSQCGVIVTNIFVRNK